MCKTCDNGICTNRCALGAPAFLPQPVEDTRSFEELLADLELMEKQQIADFVQERGQELFYTSTADEYRIYGVTTGGAVVHLEAGKVNSHLMGVKVSELQDHIVHMHQISPEQLQRYLSRSLVYVH